MGGLHTHAWTIFACFLFRLKNPETQKPHTHVFPGHMVVVVYRWAGKYPAALRRCCIRE
jgi:hypothetical protein